MAQWPSGGANPTRGIGAVLTNPVNTTAVCDTGALSSGGWLVGFVFSSTAAASVDIRHRNAADSGNIWSQRVFIPANQTIPVYVPVKDQAEAGESYDCAMAADLTGTLQGSVWVVNVG